MRKFDDYKRLIGFIKPHKWIFISSAVSMFFESVLGKIASVGAIVPFVTILLAGDKIAVPQSTDVGGFLRQGADNIASYLNSLDRLTLLNWLVAGVLILFLLKELFTYLHSYLISDLSLRVVRDIKDKLYNKLLNLSLDFYGERRAGQLVSRITYDAGVVQNAVAEGVRDLIYESIELLVLIITLILIIVIFAIPWTLILIILLVLPLVAYPVNRIGKRLRLISSNAQTKMADINSTLYETFSGVRIVQAFGMEDYEKAKFNRQNQSFYKVMLKSAKRLVAVSPLSEYISILAATLVIFFGGKYVISGKLDPGAFTAFIACLLQMIKPFKRLSKVHGINQQALAAAERIFEILDKEPSIKEPLEAVELKPLSKEIVFDNIHFKYHDDAILKDISLKVKKGEIIAIVGKSGVGKTTLVNLIPRFYDVNRGAILIDGADIREVSLDSLRGQIGIVTQETILFNDTVAANIAYGNPDASRQEIEEAAKIANAHDFIVQLPQKYYTPIGDRGVRLSGGQRQRLAIARAMLKDPPILILDEATSQLDTESEKLVQAAIDKLMKGRTVFVIAHRLSTVKHASRIIVLAEGKIAELGTHEELMAKNSHYKKLYDMQFKDK